MGISNLGCLDNLFHRGILYAKGNIVIERIIEEDSLLVYVTYQGTQLRDAYALDILSIDKHLTVLHVMITRNQVNQCRFTSVDLPDPD